MKRYSPPVVGLLQALGLALYVVLFVAIATNVERLVPTLENWAWVPIFPLLAFVTSALICAIIALGHPAYLFAQGEQKRAIRIVLWTAGWLIAFFIVAFLVIIA